MNLTVEHGNKIYALLSPATEVKPVGETEWFGKNYFPLQGSRMHYNKKSFKTHKHIPNPRIINRTQEAFIVIKGKLTVEIYEKTPNVVLLGSLTAEAGDVIFVWDGFHKLMFIEDDTIAYEIKAGQFTTVEEDKEFLPDVD